MRMGFGWGRMGILQAVTIHPYPPRCATRPLMGDRGAEARVPTLAFAVQSTRGCVAGHSQRCNAPVACVARCSEDEETAHTDANSRAPRER